MSERDIWEAVDEVRERVDQGTRALMVLAIFNLVANFVTFTILFFGTLA